MLTTHLSVAATLPINFTEALVVDGLVAPTAMALSPDGRIFVAEQVGTLRVVKNGTLLPTPFLTVKTDVTGERGLLGVTLDPDFLTNHYIYIFYTVPTAPVHNRVSRFTANGDVAIPGSEVSLLELDNLSSAINHNGGALHFGEDRKLYISTGENVTGIKSQSLTSLLGKILRINPDGSIPPDNPFYSSASDQYRAIWALGLRNPFTFAFQPGTGRMFINDVGFNAWEEINDGVAGNNYGWPYFERPRRHPASHRSHLLLPTRHRRPDRLCYHRRRLLQSVSNTVSCRINCQYFFADYCNGWIRKLVPSNNAATDFASGIQYPVDLAVEPTVSSFISPVAP